IESVEFFNEGSQLLYAVESDIAVSDLAVGSSDTDAYAVYLARAQVTSGAHSLQYSTYSPLSATALTFTAAEHSLLSALATRLGSSVASSSSAASRIEVS